MPDKKNKTLKTPVKPDDEPDPATVTKNKESARKLASLLKENIPNVQSPARRVELSDLFCDIKCKCEFEDASTTDRLNSLVAETDAELLDPTGPPGKDDTATTESEKAMSELDQEESELSYCTLERPSQTLRG